MSISPPRYRARPCISFFHVIGESFEAVIIGPLQVDIQNGNSHSIVCESNQNSSSIIWMFNGTTVQVLL